MAQETDIQRIVTRLDLRIPKEKALWEKIQRRDISRYPSVSSYALQALLAFGGQEEQTVDRLREIVEESVRAVLHDIYAAEKFSSDRKQEGASDLWEGLPEK